MDSVVQVFFVGKVLREVCYRHPNHTPLPEPVEGLDYAFEAVQFDWGHSKAFAVSEGSGIRLVRDIDEIGDMTWKDSYWYIRDDAENWSRLKGVRILEALCERGPDTECRLLKLQFGDGTQVTIEPARSEDLADKSWPADSRMLKLCFSRQAGRQRSKIVP
jgi:hypothetical protein